MYLRYSRNHDDLTIFQTDLDCRSLLTNEELVSDYDGTGTYLYNKYGSGYLFSLVDELTCKGQVYSNDYDHSNYQLAGDKDPMDNHRVLDHGNKSLELLKIKENYQAFIQCFNFSECKDNYLFYLALDSYILLDQENYDEIRFSLNFTYYTK